MISKIIPILPECSGMFFNFLFIDTFLAIPDKLLWAIILCFRIRKLDLQLIEKHEHRFSRHQEYISNLSLLAEVNVSLATH